MREPKMREDRCDKKESRERQWDPLCQWVRVGQLGLVTSQATRARLEKSSARAQLVS